MLATAVLALTLDELLRDQPAYFTWPNGPVVGAMALLALIAATVWLTRDSRPNAWAKAALALAVSLPLGWMATSDIVLGKLRGLPDGDMPDGLLDRMNADVVQMQLAALYITLGALGCIVMNARQARGA